MQPTLLGEVSVREVGAPIANANNTDANSDRIDTAGYESVMFIASVTDSAATGVATLKVEQNTTNSDSGMAALAGATATATCVVNDDINDKLLVIDVFRPRERYVQAVRTSSAANIAFGTVVAILYGPNTKPVADHSTVLDSAVVSSPAEA